MSKQEKLISANKLNNWIIAELGKRYPEEQSQYVDGRETVLEILRWKIVKGELDADPVPTIKPGDKVFKPGYGSGVVIQEGEHLYKFTDRKWVLFEGDEVPVHIRTSDLEVVKDE